MVVSISRKCMVCCSGGGFREASTLFSVVHTLCFASLPRDLERCPSKYCAVCASRTPSFFACGRSSLQAGHHRSISDALDARCSRYTFVVGRTCIAECGVFFPQCNYLSPRGEQNHPTWPLMQEVHSAHSVECVEETGRRRNAAFTAYAALLYARIGVLQQ